MIHLDSSYLVDLMRDQAEEGPAARLLSELADDEIWVSVFVLCELFAGVELCGRPAQERRRLDAICGGLNVRYLDGRFAPAYGALLARLQRIGRRIGAMDLLIATCAILDAAPLVTRNRKHFERIPGLEIITY